MTTPEFVPEESARGTGLAGVMEILRRRRLLALLPFVFVLAATASVALFLPSLWTARAKVLANQQQIPETFVKSTTDADVETRLMTLTQDILDTPRLSKVILDNDLYSSMRRSRPMADVVQRMRKDIVIEAQDDRARTGRETRWLVFTVAYTAGDPVVTTRVANTLAALFTEQNQQMREPQAVGTSEFLGAQLAELRTRLAAQERKITTYKEQHLGEPPEQSDINVRTLERLET